MRRRCTLVVGLPGSGKSWMAAHELPDHLLIDDPKRLDDILDAADADARDVAICDPNLCFEMVRHAAIALLEARGFEVDLIFFENNKAACDANLRARREAGDDRGDIDLELFSRFYEIPDDRAARRVWRAKSAAEKP